MCNFQICSFIVIYLDSGVKMVILLHSKEVGILSPRPKANSERTNVFFSPDVMDRLRTIAAEKGTSVSGLIRMIVLEYLAEKK